MEDRDRMGGKERGVEKTRETKHEKEYGEWMREEILTSSLYFSSGMASS